jgi:exonuclease VII small subunit
MNYLSESAWRTTKRVRIAEVSEGDESDTLKPEKEVSVEKKKELNRKSASQCRKRRKEYVEQLEKRVDDLENEVHSLKRKLELYEQGEKLNALSQKESILQYLTGKYDEYDNLDKLIDDYDETSLNDEELCKCINTIKIRQGSHGFVRKQTVNYLLKKVIEKMVPGHVKYIVASCANENGYFEKARGRKLAKNLDAKTQRGKYVDYAQKCQDPDGHIWKEVIYAIGMNSDEIKQLK